MLFKDQKGSPIGLNKPIVRAAFFILSFFLLHVVLEADLPWRICFLTAQGGVVGAAPTPEMEQKASAPKQAEPREYKLTYDIGFWIFPRVATGVATLERMNNPATFKVTLDAHPVGVFATLVKRRVIYQTEMEFDKKSNRLRPLRSSQKRIKDGKTREKIIKFDYEKGVCIFEYRKDAVLEKEKTISIPSGVTPEDSVTAFHNLCNGVYGEIKEGSTYNINIIVKEKPSSLTFEVCSPDYKKEFTLPENKEIDFGFVAKINVAPEVVESNKGDIFVCFSNDSVPLGVKVKDVIGFGDLYGHLVNKVLYPNSNGQAMGNRNREAGNRE